MDLDDAELEAQLRETLHRAAAPVHGEGVFKEAIRNEVARRQANRGRARWTGRIFLAAAAVAAAVALFVLVKPDQDRVDTDGGPVATEPTVPPTTVQPDPSTTETPNTTVSTTATTAASQDSSTTTTPPTAALPEFPAEAPPLHGGTRWAVYLAIVPEGQQDDPGFQAAQQATIDAGYPTGGSYAPLSCDDGAAQAFGKDPTSWGVGNYFETEALANQARDAYEARGHQVLGVVAVTTYCLD
jgi:hypothetical protein